MVGFFFIVKMADESSSNGHHESEDEEMSVYKKDANAVVTFNIIYDEQDLLKPSVSFRPVMSHQIFGENESIFGYRSLSIGLSYLHNSAQCFVNISCSGELKSDVHKPDNIMECLNPWLPENFTTSKEEFTNWTKNELHEVMYGKVLYEFTTKGKFHLDPSVEVCYKYKITQCILEDEKFKAFHSRFETLVIWHIDGANFIDLDDEKWQIFYVYEEVKHPKTDKLYVTPVGFCTAYKFFAYPDNIRNRISQFFVLPTHQRRGIGTALYNTIFKVFQENSLVIDITVEEPTPTFQKIRDIHDCGLVRKALKEHNIALLSTSIKKIFGIAKTLKLGKRQCQRVYDILCGCEASSSTPTYNQFMKNINKRIETEVRDRMEGKKKRRNADGEGVKALLDHSAVIEGEFKKYKEDLETSIDYVKNSFDVDFK